MTDAQPEFISESNGTARDEYVVMERRGTKWGTIGVSAPRETRSAAEADLATVNATREATIRRLEADLANPDSDDPDDITYATAYLANVRAGQYAIFVRTTSPFTFA